MATGVPLLLANGSSFSEALLQAQRNGEALLQAQRNGEAVSHRFREERSRARALEIN